MVSNTKQWICDGAFDCFDNFISLLFARLPNSSLHEVRRTSPAKVKNVRRRATVKFNQMSGEEVKMSGEAQKNFVYSVILTCNPGLVHIIVLRVTYLGSICPIARREETTNIYTNTSPTDNSYVPDLRTPRYESELFSLLSFNTTGG